MQLQEINFEEWIYPPTLSKSTGKGKRPFDYKHVIHIQTNAFNHPVILMSDLHQHAFSIVQRLANYVDLSKFVVLSVGDMAGNGYFGSNGDPTETYEFLADRSLAFYFVQGNHDLPSKHNSHLDLRNADGTRCMIRDGKVTKTLLGKVSGINGIVTRSNKGRIYRLVADDFYELVETTLRRHRDLSVFMTHETPAIPLKVPDDPQKLEKLRMYDGSIRTALNGKGRLFDLVDKYKPNVHVYGHCHHRTYTHLINKVRYFNADSRILICKPPKVE